MPKVTAYVLSAIAITTVITGVAVIPAVEESDGGVATAQPETEPNETSISFTRQPTDGQTVVIDEITLEDGGFIAVHDTRLEPPDPEVVESVVGFYGYLRPGTYTNVTVTLAEPVSRTTENRLIAMPHNDTDGDRLYDFVTSNGMVDGPYERDGRAITDSATLDLQEQPLRTASIGFENQTVNDSTVVVSEATLSRGGYVAVTDSDDEVIGVSGYLPPRSVQNITIDLEQVPNETTELTARAHLDTDGDRFFGFAISDGGVDGPYPTGGSNGGDAGNPVETARVEVPTNSTR